MHRKLHLSEKPYRCCGRLFVWRKRWAQVWDEVKYCSERCRRQRKQSLPPEAQT